MIVCICQGLTAEELRTQSLLRYEFERARDDNCFKCREWRKQMTNDNQPPHFELHPNFGDVEAMMNVRTWLEKALEKSGAKIVGGGMGMGTADVDITLEGFRFDVSIRAIEK